MRYRLAGLIVAIACLALKGTVSAQRQIQVALRVSW